MIAQMMDRLRCGVLCAQVSVRVGFLISTEDT